MQTTEQQLLRARELIRQFKYEEARRILLKVDHPKAREWLGKIEQILSSKPKKKGGARLAALIVLILIAITGLLIINRNNHQAFLDAYRSEAYASLSIFCTLGTTVDDLRCDQYVAETLRNYPETMPDIAICGKVVDSISDPEQFARCLIRHDVPLPF